MGAGQTERAWNAGWHKGLYANGAEEGQVRCLMAAAGVGVDTEWRTGPWSSERGSQEVTEGHSRPGGWCGRPVAS